MRIAVLLLLLAGCGAPPAQVVPAAAAFGIGSIAVIQRSPLDAVYSILSGRDCSIVRLDEAKSYCRPIERVPITEPYCTRSLGVVDCWLHPASLPDHPPPVGDGLHPLSPEQEADRLRGWPNL